MCCCCSEDGKDSMKFYTDPGHFFELWCEQMMAKEAELQTKKQRQRNRKPVSMNMLCQCVSDNITLALFWLPSTTVFFCLTLS